MSGEERDGWVDWGWSELVTGTICQLACKYLKIFTGRISMGAHGLDLNLENNTLALYCSFVLAARL